MSYRHLVYVVERCELHEGQYLVAAFTHENPAVAKEKAEAKAKALEEALCPAEKERVGFTVSVYDGDTGGECS